MNEWLTNHLVCPRDKQKLQLSENKLTCTENHTYPIVKDIPVMLLEEKDRTHGYITKTLEKVSQIQASGEAENDTVSSLNGETEVDPFVQNEIVYTCGTLYIPLTNKLSRYPIPELRLPQGTGERLLDVGCNWGRWSVAAAQMGYQPVGIDPSLDAVLAARRISRQLKLETSFVVGDARFLPFASGCFDVGFSYGVFQHFSKDNAKTSLDEIARVVKKNGKVLVQMPNKYGVRSFYQQARRGFSEGEEFEVRYWSPSELRQTFEETFGDTRMSVDCYFGLGIQKSDVDLLTPRFKMVIHSSEFLRKISRKVSGMVKVADSVYLESVNQKQS
jgi:SAM-dependent methyltransferase/uncharacterized protein YbaR (Trm112 family)